ncbi:MAG: tripartite tricarboxylate transporter substrate-binding protein [Pseudolabrys sp.]
MRVPSFCGEGRLSKLIAAVAVVAMLAAPRPAAAEEWPARPVTLVMAFASGAMIDFVGRVIANDLSTTLGQPVVVETKAGAGGVVAGAYVAKSAPDGYTLLMTAVGPAVLRPLIDKSVGYDTDADFTPIILIGESPNVLLADPKLGVSTVKNSWPTPRPRTTRSASAIPGPAPWATCAPWCSRRWPVSTSRRFPIAARRRC